MGNISLLKQLSLFSPIGTSHEPLQLLLPGPAQWYVGGAVEKCVSSAKSQ